MDYDVAQALYQHEADAWAVTLMEMKSGRKFDWDVGEWEGA